MCKHLIPGLLIVLSLNSLAIEVPPPARKIYSATTELPIYVAYHGYLEVVHSLQQEGQARAVDFLVDSLRLTEAAGGRAAALSALEMLEESYWDIRRAVTESELKTACYGTRAGWSDDQIYMEMDQQDDVNEAIYEEHYLSTLLQLADPTAKLLREELERHKLRMTYVKLDHKKAWGQVPDTDIRQRLAEICLHLQEKHVQLWSRAER